MACRISVPRPGIELTLLTLEAQSQPLDLQGSPYPQYVIPNCASQIYKGSQIKTYADSDKRAGKKKKKCVKRQAVDLRIR